MIWRVLVVSLAVFLHSWESRDVGSCRDTRTRRRRITPSMALEGQRFSDKLVRPLRSSFGGWRRQPRPHMMEMAKELTQNAR